LLGCILLARTLLRMGMLRIGRYRVTWILDGFFWIFHFFWPSVLRSQFPFTLVALLLFHVFRYNRNGSIVPYLAFTKISVRLIDVLIVLPSCTGIFLYNTGSLGLGNILIRAANRGGFRDDLWSGRLHIQNLIDQI